MSMNKKLGVLTSGGDAPGMNAAVRSVVRSALNRNIPVYAIYEGYQGMVDGGDSIHPMDWDSVGGILHRGGTIIGSARCQEFRERAGRLRAATNLLKHGINSLIIIGGDGSLTGANLFREEWPSLLEELVSTGVIDQQTAQDNAYLTIAGMVGSIDNDMFGTDMTIGADTALHRITEAIDAIVSTAASHQRTFVVEVMGRHCGYLALMSALATAADWVLIPEYPPQQENWEDVMCEVLKAGREAGRRDSLVVIAEGARDLQGKTIDSAYIKQILEERLQQDVRVTILGHVQRGGSPSAFDRVMSTLVGYAAVETIASATPDSVPCLVGLGENRISRSPLMECVAQTKAVAKAIENGDYGQAMALRGQGFERAFRTYRTLVRSRPHPPKPGQKQFRFAVLNAGTLAPGMNAASRVAIRVGIDQGHTMLGVHNGFQGFIDQELREMDWMSVAGWASQGGSELGVSRKPINGSDYYTIARCLEAYRIDGILMIGGWSGYETAYQLHQERQNFPAFNIPIICLAASIDNNLPGCELSIGADTALNNIVSAVDKIKQSAVATRRTFVVEVMGHYCGYLTLGSGLANGAERVYLNEEGITLKDLQADVEKLVTGFRQGKRLGLVIRNNNANPIYTTPFICALFEQEGGGLFEVRQAILGHLQQGGDPSPFDRIQATQLATQCVEFLIDQTTQGKTEGAFMGLMNGQVRIQNLEDFPRMIDKEHYRPRDQWWMRVRPIARMLAQPNPGYTPDYKQEV